ncbi:MAG: AraC family transcriptional regulator [Cupriavidus necator]
MSSDPDEVRDQVSRVFCQHRLQVAGKAQPLDTRLYYRQLRDIGIGRMSYGATVDIDPGMLRDFYLLQMPTRGHEVVEMAGQRVLSTPRTATLVSPAVSFRMQHGEGTEKLFLRVDRAALERHFARLYGQPARGVVCFVPEISLETPAGASICRLLQWLAAEASGGLMLDQPLAAASVEEMVITSLLDGLPHNQGAYVPRADAGVSPRCLRRARDYIAQHIDEPLTVGAIAAHAGMSSRSLHVAFRKYHDTTPMAYLRDLRLDKVRTELLGGSADGARPSVTATALRWGFTHLGQFAASYRQCFGELPSQTLARSMH